MRNETGKFKFKVPADAIEKSTGELHQDAGKTLENQPFDYEVCETVEEAEKLAESKGWTLLQFVNDTLKTNARASAYQNKLALYKPSDVSAEDIQARVIRDLIRLGMSEEQARAMVTSGSGQ